MKLTIFIITVALMQVSAAGFAQRISLSERNTAISVLLSKIQQQSGYDIFYKNKLIEDTKINISLKEVSLETALKAVLDEQELEFSIEDKLITIQKKEPSFLDRVVARFKAIDVKGRVVDQDGKPLPNASIRVKGKSAVTNTDANGVFEIKEVDEDAVLLVSYVGFKTLEIALKDAVMPLEIKLNVATGELEEVSIVINTGYQTQKVNEVTGSITHIDNEMFNRRVGSTVLDRISDLVPGLLTTRSTSNVLNEITIRGVSTINSNKTPLLVVDNFIYEGEALGNLNSLNPNDIESVTILKDAAAASIWGARAGNGVIVLTTKKGKYNQPLKVSFSSNVIITEKPDLFAMPTVLSKDIIELERRRFTNGYYNASLTNITSYPALPMAVEILAKQRSSQLGKAEAEAQIIFLENHDVRNDINKYLLQNAISQQYALNLSGGAGSYKYYGAMGYNKAKPNDVNKRDDSYTLRFNNTWKPMSKLELTTGLNWVHANSKSTSDFNYNQALQSPYLRLADQNGNALAIPNTYRMTYVDTVSFPGLLNWQYRPLEEINSVDNRNRNYNIQIGTSASYTILPGLKASLNYQWQRNLNESKNIQSMDNFRLRDLVNRHVTRNPATGQLIYPYPLGATLSSINATNSSWNVRGQLDYSSTWKKHRLNAIAGAERREAESEGVNLPIQYGFDPSVYTFKAIQYGSWTTRPIGITTTLTPIPVGISGNVQRWGSYFANVSYTFNDRYTLSGSGRIDESNFFGVKANDRKAPLWSTGLMWNIAQEAFYHLSWLPDLKLKINFGYNGNTNAGTTPLATARAGTNPDISLPTLFFVTPANPQLRWERVRNINIGINFGTKDSRIIGSLEVYQKQGLDLLSAISVDATSGVSSYTGNNASIKGKGIDLGLNSQNLNGAFKWNTNLNFSYNTEKVTHYEVALPTTGIGYLSSSLVVPGKPLNKLYSQRSASLNPANGDARLYINNQIVGSIDYTKAKPEDMIYHGRTSPSVFGSFINNFSWKSISVSIGINYRFGYYFKRTSFNGVIGGTSSPAAWVHKDYLSAWKNPGDELRTNVPGFLDSYTDNRYSAYGFSDILIEKGDHIRLQDIRLSYSLNRYTIKKLPFQSITIYAYANNLGVLWVANKHNLDPENPGSERGTPIPRTIALGLSFGF